MAKQVKAVRIIGRYTFHNGAIVYRVENGEQKQYCCTMHKDGTWTCMGKDDQCRAQKYSKNHTCYHTEYCQKREQEYYKDGVLIDTAPQAEVVSEREQVLAAKRAASDQELARIDAEVQAQIAEEQAAPTAPKSEQARIADIEDDDPWEGLDDEEKYVAWRNYEMSIAG